MDAARLKQIIEDMLDEAGDQEYALDHSWMHLGRLLAQFKTQEAWRDTGYISFDAFMEDLRKKYKRGRTQLWAYLTVAETLNKQIEGYQLEEMGISKALVLKHALKKSGKDKLPADLIEAALRRQVTAKELRAMAAEAMNIELAPDRGTWFDFDGCYMTPEDRKEFRECVTMTEKLLDLPKELPEHIRRKEIFFAWMKEFFGTHAAEVYGPQEPAEFVGIRKQDSNSDDIDGYSERNDF